MRSQAFIRAYGGALGGGKSRCMMEVVFDYALDYPGLVAVVARDAHTSIINTTRKTMLEHVIPSRELIAHEKKSGGEDYIELFNGSTVHFIGMDDPYRWYSSEIGVYALDEAQEIANFDEEKVIRLINRLRQRCGACVKADEPDCDHMPHKALLSFNPSSPDHWLYQWFIKGAQRTDFGFAKHELFLEEAEDPIGDCEFVFALPTDNPYLSQGYLKRLRGMKPHMRRRYLEGKWEFLGGLGFFDPEALMFYEGLADSTRPIMQGKTAGDVELDAKYRQAKMGRCPDPPRVQSGPGGLMVWRRPDPNKRYVMAIDVSSGGSHDYSAIQVVCIEDFEQVAEWQGKTDTDLVAQEAYRIGRIFNNALAVPEITGGYGVMVDQRLKELRYKPMHTRTTWDKLSKKWTDRTGWDTTTKTRQAMLDTLEEVLR
jgi:hypothetical protein